MENFATNNIEAIKKIQLEQKKENRDKHFIIMPYYILWDHELTIQERVLLALLKAFDHEEDDCYATNKELSDIISLSERSVRALISSLKEKGRILDLGKRKNRRILSTSPTKNRRLNGNNYFIIQEHILRDKNIHFTERVLLAMINSLDRNEDHCYANNFHFQSNLGFCRKHIQEMIHDLIQKRRIEDLGRRNNRRVLKSLSKDKRMALLWDRNWKY